MRPAASPFPEPLPLVGRASEQDLLRSLLVGAQSGDGLTVGISGNRGVGKSRLLQAVRNEARERGFQVVDGRAYPAEHLVPYAIFADAFLPFFLSIDPARLSVLTRGGEEDLAYLFPVLGRPRAAEVPSFGDPVEFTVRLFWNFTEFLKRVAEKQPLLVVLEDLQWADESSLELFHFVARQTVGTHVLVVYSYSDSDLDRATPLKVARESLRSLGVNRELHLSPLGPEATIELVRRTFDVDESVVRDFGSLLFRRTRGNALFIEGTLRDLVESGRLYNNGTTWLGWEVDDLGLPRSVRDSILARTSRLSGTALALARLASVFARRVPLRVLRPISGLDDEQLLDALDELRRHQILAEDGTGRDVGYDFAHPLIQETLQEEQGHARARANHQRVAEALERLYGEEALDHADELAYHFAQLPPGSNAGKAVRYLTAAGEAALARRADHEAVRYLESALERFDALARTGELGAGGQAAAAWAGQPEPGARARMALARALDRLGEYDASAELWTRLLADADAAVDHARAAGLRRRLGLACFWTGRLADARIHYLAGLASAERAGDDIAAARLKLAAGVCYQQAGRIPEAREALEGALAIADAHGSAGLLARVHRALTLLYTWSGDPERVRAHAGRALALAQECGDRGVAFWSHWALAVMEGMRGDTDEMVRRVREMNRLEEELRSPVLGLWTAELEVELAYAVGDWVAGLARGEAAIAQARSFRQHTLLPRLLVWTALIYLGRGEMERARGLIDEAWEISGASGAGGPLMVDVHAVVPAHIGRAAYHLAMDELDDAVRFAEAGLAIADETGYVTWAIHHVLPIIGEAHLRSRNLEAAERIGRRLRRDSEAMGHDLGLAWARACEAIVVWLRGDPRAGASLLRNAAEALESIPLVWDGARLRRQLAGRLAEIGDVEGAYRELKIVHDVFERLGARGELERARVQFAEIEKRPPRRGSGAGAAGLTGRELEVAQLAARRLSNKAIAKELGIASRTVGTHLANVYRKLDIGSRNDLTDLVRDGVLPEGPTESA